MRELYELTTLAFPLLSAAEVAKAAREWISMPDADGTLLGCWRTEMGPLGRMLILRRFEAAAALQRERRRALLSSNPFNAGGVITALEMDSYMPFSFLPPAQPVALDAVYEFRTYKLKPGGLPPTLAGWEAAIEPARDYTAHLMINMYALDGPPRITHIWGFDSLAQRGALRTAAYSAGIWPPKGGPENILEAMSVIALPESE
ncbi:NIPSNAP family protein [Hansschlegelia plantiphila]|uniref:NIPSNAP family protein n=1 Tax=Hansschlegelia plantiphila TaxID=374655 RepID=A0A9W6J0H8_9HYPH|nr:NIPSNAP family protein [Hansschlegelia plantiphila]GLK67473.1 NIPSNAP family protein [Hansschlegelia plantiphila]